MSTTLLLSYHNFFCFELSYILPGRYTQKGQLVVLGPITLIGHLLLDRHGTDALETSKPSTLPFTMDHQSAQDGKPQRAQTSLSFLGSTSIPNLQEVSGIPDIEAVHGATPAAVEVPDFLLDQQQTSQSVNKQHPTEAELSLTGSRSRRGPHDAISRSSSLSSECQTEMSVKQTLEGSVSRTASLREHASASRRPSLEILHEHDRSAGQMQALKSLQASQAPSTLTALPRRQTVKRHSSLRHQTRPSEVKVDMARQPFHHLDHSASDSQLSPGKVRPKSHPPSRSPMPDNDDINNLTNHTAISTSNADDPWSLPPLSCNMPQTPRSTHMAPTRAPSLTFRRLSSLDRLITYREDRESWKRESYVSAQQLPVPTVAFQEPMLPIPSMPVNEESVSLMHVEKSLTSTEAEFQCAPDAPVQSSKFRHFAAEVGFCFTIAMTQLLAEYMISGFAIVLPNLLDQSSSDGAGMTGLFWPAALLTLILSAFLLIFARISDMYAGYGPFMFGIIWLAIWTLIPGFFSSSIVLNVSRAMQGLAIAAYTPSTFSMVGSIYPEGPRRNIVLGLYGACAPLGMYTGFLVGGDLPAVESEWYFWIASILAFITAVTAYLSVPHDRTDRKGLDLNMDWLGAILITGGLILVTYALSVQPYANVDHPEINGFAFRIVWVPLSSGVACLVVAFWVEGWYASCPLLPFEFFRPQGVKAFCIACLFFYGSFGVWLYNSAE
jgi:MFS family permease